MTTDRKSTIGRRPFARLFGRWFLCSAAIIVAAQTCRAQQGVLGTNLIVNGGAEVGPASTSTTNLVTNIPSWTRTGSATVLPYDLTGSLLLSDPGPPDHGFQYFAAPYFGSGSAVSTMTQDIDVSAGASIIGSGNVKFTASAYLGSIVPYYTSGTAQLAVAFKNANGQTFSSTTLGPLGTNGAVGAAISLQQKVGLVPAGTVRITVTLTLISFGAGYGGYGAADSLSLVLNTLGTSPGFVLGTNLVVNGGAEAGPAAPVGTRALYVPGWSNSMGASVAPYGGTGWIGVADPGPADRGVNLFGGGGGAISYQDIDVSPAASLIDSGQVKYVVSGWLGALAGQAGPTLTYLFFDWSGKQLAATAQVGPPSPSGTGLVELSHSDTLPAGTRRVQITLTFPGSSSLADNIGFLLATPSGPPVITPAGVLTAGAFGGFTAIAPGSWIEIYGTYLASSTLGWSGSDFINGIAPTTLGGITVSIGGKAAFIDYVSPGQIDALVPSDAPLGPVEVTIKNAIGTSDGFGIYVSQTQPGLLAPPSFQIGGKQYLAALFTDGSFAIPLNAITGVASHPAKPGDTLTIYGIGFGPVSPGFTAGTVVTQANSLTTPVQFLFGSTPATATYYGLVPSYTGLYQFNVVVPNVTANNAVPISFTVGGAKGSQTLYIAVAN